MLSKNYFKLIIVSLSLLGVTCGGGATNMVNQTISVEGGTIVSSDGKLFLTFPPNAVEGPTEISIEVGDEGAYILGPPLTFNPPIQFSYLVGPEEIQRVLDEIQMQNPEVDPASLAGLGLAFLDTDPIDQVATGLDGDGNVIITGTLDHFSKLDLSYTHLLELEVKVNLFKRAPQVGEEFTTKYKLFSRKGTKTWGVNDVDGNFVEWQIASLRLDKLVLEEPFNVVTLFPPKERGKGVELIHSGFDFMDEETVGYKCNRLGAATLSGFYHFTLHFVREGKAPRTFQAFQQAFTHISCVDTQVEALFTHFALSPLSVGSIVPTSCISGGNRGSADEPNCDCEHQHGTISVFGLSTYPDPNESGCGHGCIIMVNITELDQGC